MITSLKASRFVGVAMCFASIFSYEKGEIDIAIWRMAFACFLMIVSLILDKNEK